MAVQIVARHIGLSLPICREPHCLMCVVRRSAGESRDQFVARLRALYLLGLLHDHGRGREPWERR